MTKSRILVLWLDEALLDALVAESIPLGGSIELARKNTDRTEETLGRRPADDAKAVRAWLDQRGAAALQSHPSGCFRVRHWLEGRKMRTSLVVRANPAFQPEQAVDGCSTCMEAAATIQRYEAEVARLHAKLAAADRGRAQAETEQRRANNDATRFKMVAAVRRTRIEQLEQELVRHGIPVPRAPSARAAAGAGPTGAKAPALRNLD